MGGAPAEGAVAGARVRDPVGAFCAHDDVTIAGAARGPLAGLAFAVKDAIAVRGATACFGNPTWLATHEPAARSAPVVSALCDAGATLAGLTLTDELALSLTGENAHYGTPINVRCPDRVPGGSSSGSAAAVAAGLVDFALGTDTGGSVRVPASHCGLYGFRPSHGAVSTEGVWPLAPRFDTVGWLARDARTLARVGDALLPPAPARARPPVPPAASPPRLLLAEEVAAIVDASAFRALERVAAALAGRLGRPLAPVTVGDAAAPIESWLATYLALQNVEAADAHRAWIERARPAFGTLIGGRFARALCVTAAAAAAAAPRARALEQRLGALLAGGSWLVWPSAAGAPPLRGLPDDASDEVTGRSLTLAAPASLAGLPQVSLPLGEADGCPFGISLVGPRGSDRALLAAAVEQGTNREGLA
jgi:amidase